MTTATRRAMLAVVTALVLLALGAGVGVVVGDALGIRTEPATQMEPAPPVVPAAHARPSCRREFTAIDAPQTVRVDVALEELRMPRPTPPATAGEASLTVVAGNGDPADETYRLSGTPRRCASTRRARPGRCAGSTTSPRRCAPGVRSTSTSARRSPRACRSAWSTWAPSRVTPDPAAWEAGDDYSHASKAFADVLLPEPPYIDPESLAERVRRLRRVHPALARRTATTPSRSRASSSTSPSTSVRTARSTPRATIIARRRSRCGRRSGRSGTTPTSSA